MKRGTLLGIFAHPDDEAFGPGGTLARCAAEGFDLHVCTLTDGAAGTADPGCWDCLEGYQDLTERRREELDCSVETLGGSLHYFGYRDSGMAGSEANHHPDAFINQPLEGIADRLAELFRRLRPDVIVTHDDTGGYFHPDHIHTHQAVVMAFQEIVQSEQGPERPGGGRSSGSSPALYCHVIPKQLIRRLVWIYRLTGQDPTHYGRNHDIDMTRIGKPEDQIHVRIDVRRTLPIKRRAGACHSSQGGGSALRLRKGASLRDRLIFGLRQWFNQWEYFQQLHPTPTNHRRNSFL